MGLLFTMDHPSATQSSTLSLMASIFSTPFTCSLAFPPRKFHGDRMTRRISSHLASDSGGAGLILVVTLFTDHYIITGILALLASICWFVMGVLAVWLYKKTYDHYKAEGHTFKDAKNDAYGRIGRSNAARDAAVNMALNSRN